MIQEMNPCKISEEIEYNNLKSLIKYSIQLVILSNHT